MKVFRSLLYVEAALNMACVPFLMCFPDILLRAYFPGGGWGVAAIELVKWFTAMSGAFCGFLLQVVLPARWLGYSVLFSAHLLRPMNWLLLCRPVLLSAFSCESGLSRLLPSVLSQPGCR